MKTPSPYPVPKMRLKGNTWEIYWNWNRTRYFFYPGVYGERNKKYAASIMFKLAAGLSSDNPHFENPIAQSGGVKKYLSDRYGVNSPDELKGDWLEAYKATLSTTAGKGWQAHTLRYLDGFKSFVAEFSKATPNQAQEFLNRMIGSGLSPSTRNKAFSVCMKFYKWAVRTGRTNRNPFDGIRQLKEAVDHNIIYCTPEERDMTIAAAKDSGWTDWLSVPIAFYSGMRREEIARLEWTDIKFDVGLIKISKTKTGRSRETPLHKTLEQILLSVPKPQREGFVVLMDHRASEQDHDEQRSDRMIAFVKYLRKTIKKQHKNFDIERIGWNPFRHTFASLAVQRGIEIDTVSAWIGNTPEVCRRHYAQFIPRDRRDNRIDLL